jgi:hypothetical protein
MMEKERERELKEKMDQDQAEEEDSDNMSYSFCDSDNEDKKEVEPADVRDEAINNPNQFKVDVEEQGNTERGERSSRRDSFKNSSPNKKASSLDNILPLN